MDNIVEIYNKLPSKVEQEQFIVKQYATIVFLLKEKDKLEKEVEHLKHLLMESTHLLQQPKTEVVEKLPEEILIETQLSLLHIRNTNTEITLEDAKKLDLLLKNKAMLKAQNASINAESKKIDKRNLTNAELVKIALTKDHDPPQGS